MFCFFLSFSFSCTNWPNKKTIANTCTPCLFYALWSLPALLPLLCQKYHCHCPLVDHQAVPKQYESHSLDFASKCKKENNCLSLEYFRLCSLKSPLPKKRDAVSSLVFLSLQIGNMNLCLTWKRILENMLLGAVLQCWGGTSVRDQIFPIYIFYYSPSQSSFF